MRYSEGGPSRVSEACRHTPFPESPNLSARGFAVGTALSGGPPHRSQRAALPHWAPASGAGIEAHVWEGMLHTGRREPPGCDAVHPYPVETVALAAAP